MTKWAPYKSKFRVKISYRKSQTRGTIALPSPILAAWGYPEYLDFSHDVNGDAIITPIAPTKPSSTDDVETGTVEDDTV